MVDKKNAPDVPDARDTAGFQTGTSIGMTSLNTDLGNTKTITPYGKVVYKKTKKKKKYTDPYTGETYKVPKYKEIVKLSPEGQKQFDLQQQTNTNLLGLANKQSSFLSDYMSKPFELGDFDFGADLGVDAYQPGQSLEGSVYNGDPLTLGNEATEARLFELGSKRLDPKFARDKENLQSSLLARGIREGTPAWAAAMGQFSEGENDAYNSLLLSGRGQAADEMMAEWQAGLTGQGQTFQQQLAARGLGMQEQGQQFSQSMADRARLLSERGQQTGEAFAERSQPLNEIAALLGTGQVTVPDPKGITPQMNPITDVAGLINNEWDQQFKAWQAESAAQQSLFGGIMGGVSNLIASDKRIKDDIEQVGETNEGLPIYEFRIGDDGEMQAGVMAQDVEKVNPEAVVDTPQGIKAVDYEMAVGAGDGTYTVEKGDTLWDIGQRFNVPYQEIAAVNGIANPDQISPGQTLQIPGMATPDPAKAIPMGNVGSVADALSPIAGRPEFPGALPAEPFVSQVGGRPEMPGALPGAEQQGMAPADPAMTQFAAGNQGSDYQFSESPEAAYDRMTAEREAMNAAMDARAGTGMAPASSIDVFSPGQTGEEMRPPQMMPEAERDAILAELERLKAKAAPVGTVEAGSTGGEWFTPHDPMPPEQGDPLAGRVSQGFDMEQDAMIMDLIEAFQRRNQPQNPMMALGRF